MVHFMHALDNVHAEPESKLLVEQAAAKETANIEQAQGKPDTSH
jgi:hypothetical protein